MIDALDHVVMFVPSVRDAARWYSSILQLPLGCIDDDFEAAGATLYRGPLAIESGQGVCQFADPFGNLFGLVGPHAGT